MAVRESPSQGGKCVTSSGAIAEYSASERCGDYLQIGLQIDGVMTRAYMTSGEKICLGAAELNGQAKAKEHEAKPVEVHAEVEANAKCEVKLDEKRAGVQVEEAHFGERRMASRGRRYQSNRSLAVKCSLQNVTSHGFCGGTDLTSRSWVHRPNQSSVRARAISFHWLFVDS